MKTIVMSIIAVVVVLVVLWLVAEFLHRMEQEEYEAEQNDEHPARAIEERI